MNINNCWLLSLFFTALLCHAQPTTDVHCKRFRELLEQPGLKREVKLPHPFLFSGELVEPSIVLTNTTGRTMEIPDLERATGIVVTTTLPAIRSPFAGKQGKEQELCSFPTLGLVPGEERSFRFPVNKSGVFDESLTEPPSWLPHGGYAAGLHVFSVWLGRIEMQGTYTTEVPSIEDYACVEKQDRSSQRTKPIMEGQYCRLFLIGRVNNETALFSGGADISVQTFQVWLRMAGRPDSQQGKFPVSRHAPLRLINLKEGTRFAVSKSPEVSKPSAFRLILADGSAFSLADLNRRHNPATFSLDY